MINSRPFALGGFRKSWKDASEGPPVVQIVTIKSLKGIVFSPRRIAHHETAAKLPHYRSASLQSLARLENALELQ
jgi:hypothetical protein